MLDKETKWIIQRSKEIPDPIEEKDLFDNGVISEIFDFSRGDAEHSYAALSNIISIISNGYSSDKYWIFILAWLDKSEFSKDDILGIIPAFILQWNEADAISRYYTEGFLWTLNGRFVRKSDPLSMSRSLDVARWFHDIGRVDTAFEVLSFIFDRLPIIESGEHGSVAIVLHNHKFFFDDVIQSSADKMALRGKCEQFRDYRG